MATLAVVATATALVALIGLGGCSTLPESLAEQRLDRETGATLFVLVRPIELIATTRRAENADPFAFVGPIETDRMGAHAYFIWIATPGDTPLAAVAPQLLCDGEPLKLPVNAAALPAAGAAPPAGISARPYDLPAPWSLESWFEVDPETLRALGRCGRLAIEIRYQSAGEVRFEGDGAKALHSFLALAEPG
jgi:hypothetical protein